MDGEQLGSFGRLLLKTPLHTVIFYIGFKNTRNTSSAALSPSCLNYLLSLLSVRLAEWSKAPDSRFKTFLSMCCRMGVLVHECGRGFESHI